MLKKNLVLSLITIVCTQLVSAEQPVISYPDIRLADFKAMQEKIDKGTDLNAFDSSNVSPLFLTVLLGEVDVARFLIENGADVNLIRSDGATPIFLSPNEEMIDFLVSRGADINHATPYGFTPLTSAMLDQKFWMAEHLVRIGADVNVMKLEGRTPLNILNQRKDTPLGQRESHLRKLIIAAGGQDFSIRNKNEFEERSNQGDSCDDADVSIGLANGDVYEVCKDMRK